MKKYSGRQPTVDPHSGKASERKGGSSGKGQNPLKPQPAIEPKSGKASA